MIAPRTYQTLAAQQAYYLLFFLSAILFICYSLLSAILVICNPCYLQSLLSAILVYGILLLPVGLHNILADISQGTKGEITIETNIVFCYTQCSYNSVTHTDYVFSFTQRFFCYTQCIYIMLHKVIICFVTYTTVLIYYVTHTDDTFCST